MLKAILLTTLTILLAGCEKNPILGEWEQKYEKQPNNGLFNFPKISEKWYFDKNRATYNGFNSEVDYEINGNRVIVKGKSKIDNILGTGMEFIVIDERTIKKTNIFGKDVYFNRTQWPN